MREALLKEEGAARGRSLQQWLYDKRSGPKMWLGVVGCSVVVMFLAALLVGRLNEFFTCDLSWLKSSVPWTIILALGGAPIAWVIWLIRDHVKLIDQNKADATLNQAKATENRQKEQAARAHAQQVFEKLQEWATGEKGATLQAAALYQLRPFMLGLAEGPIPERLAGVTSPFIVPSLSILRALLDDRGWLEKWEQEHKPPQEEGKGPQEGPRSPVLLAIESFLLSPAFTERLQPGNPKSPYQGTVLPGGVDRWNLSGLSLDNAQWNGCVLNGAKLDEVWLSRANLSGAHLRQGHLHKAHLLAAKLHGADLVGADLKEVRGRGAEFIGADMEDADLQDAELPGANFVGAKLEGANFTRTDLTKARFQGEALQRGKPVEVGVKMLGATMEDATLEGVNFSGMNLVGLILRGAKLKGANMKDVDLNGADLTGAKRPENDLQDWGWKTGEEDHLQLLPDDELEKRGLWLDERTNCPFRD